MRGDIFTVFVQFHGTKEDLARAVAAIGKDSINLNPHSGKWNVHCTDAATACQTFCRQLEEAQARPAPVILGELSFEEYTAPGGPGVAQRINLYQSRLQGLRLCADGGDLLAKRDYATNSKPDSIVNTVIWAYLRGEINDAMRFDMSRDWQEHAEQAKSLQPT